MVIYYVDYYIEIDKNEIYIYLYDYSRNCMFKN